MLIFRRFCKFPLYRIHHVNAVSLRLHVDKSIRCQLVYLFFSLPVDSSLEITEAKL